MSKYNLKKENFKEVDDAFLSLMNDKTYKKSAETIERVLKKTFDKNVHVNIIKAPRNSPYNVMSIFPNKSTIDKIVDAIVEEKNDKIIKELWDETTDWTLEIDNRTLTGDVCDLSSKELTALLLHECGHIIYSNSIPHRITKIMKYEYAKANVGTKGILKDKIFKKIMSIPIIKACMYENYRTDFDLKRELKADFFAVKMGYGDELESALDKFISKSPISKPTATNINKDSDKVYSDMKSDTIFSIKLAEQFKERKGKVSKEQMKKMLLNNPSVFVKNTLGGIVSDLFESSNDIVQKDSIYEDRACRLYENAYMTEVFGFKKNVKRIDPMTIEYIAVKLDSMRSNDDKLMLISYIYSKLDIIDYYLDLMNNPKTANRYIIPHTRNELTNMKLQLEKLKESVVNKKIPEYRYSVRVDYPDGYEG